MPLPEYDGNSIVNLMSSLGLALGAEVNQYPALSTLSPAELNKQDNIVLLVVDGLGYEYLVNHGEGSFLHKNLRTKITSVFPSTTATAITTFMTGQAPQQHGLTGWFTYLKELGCVTAVLPFRPRVGCNGFNSNTIDVHRLYNHVPFFDLINRLSYVVAPEWIIHSEYNVAHSGSALLYGYNSLEQFVKNIEKIIKSSSEEEKYIYAYWPDFDRYSHEAGCGSLRVHKHFNELDAAFESLVSSLAGTNTRIIVTADHGFTDVGESKVIQISEHPVIENALVLPLCGEPRMAYCYIHPEKEGEFIDYVETKLADAAELKASKRLVEEGYFGYGAAHPALHHRIGHYAMIMKEDYVIKDHLSGEPPFHHIGVHGGISTQEMHVPLIILDC